VERVRLVPTIPTVAPLEFTFRTSPSVDVAAGITTDVAWFCACDHCDEDVTVVIENLEHEVSAVVEGGFREWLNDPENGYDGDDLGGSGDVSEPNRGDLRAKFRDVPPQWAPWPRR
jgi:hypothetical protein